MLTFKQKINNIKKEADFSNGQLFLIETTNEKSGFLLGKEELYFIIQNNSEKAESIETSFLSLKTNICINTIENFPSFKPGRYDILIYNTGIDDAYLDSFVELCKSYIITSQEIKFDDFFYSLLKLFEPQKEVSFSNLVGIFGELCFIQKMFNDHNLYLSKYWHNSLGPNDKYDFSCGNINIEVKTTTKEEKVFSLKHSQIFNEKSNFIVVINLDIDNAGISVSDLFHFFKKTKPFSNDLNFLIKLENEKKKVSPNDFVTKKFSLSKMSAFLNSDLETITSIPECISCLTYSYDFVGKKTTSFDEIAKEI